LDEHLGLGWIGWVAESIEQERETGIIYKAIREFNSGADVDLGQ